MNPSSRSSSSKERITSTQNRISKKNAPLKTCLIPTKELEVLCELAVDINNLKANGFQCDARIFEQGWSKYLDRLVGPIYPELVKDFWVHATITPTAIISFVLGHEVIINENLIRKLYGLNDEEGWAELQPHTVDWALVQKQISTVVGIDSHLTGNLRPFYKVWAEIILGSLHHRKKMRSSSYISQTHMYTLFCIGKKMEINISHILFENLKTSIFESREDERAKYPHIPRTTIPFGRMISDILIESKVVDFFRNPNASHSLEVTHGPIFNGVDLFGLEVIKKVPVVCTSFPDIMSRRIAVEGFISLFHKELDRVVKFYLEDCVRKQSDVDPAWIRGRVLPSKEDILKKDKKEEQARLKRKAQEDEAERAKKLRVTYDPDTVGSSERRNLRIRDPLHRTRSSFSSRQVYTPPPSVPKPSVPKPSLQSPPSETKANFILPTPSPSSFSSPILNPTPLNTLPPTPSDKSPSLIPFTNSPPSPQSIPSDTPTSSIILLDIPSSSTTAPPPSISHPLPTRISQPYSLLYPDCKLSLYPPEPEPSTYLELFRHEVINGLDLLKEAFLSGLNDVSLRNIWKRLHKVFKKEAVGVQRRLVAAAPRSRGMLRNFEEFWVTSLKGRYLLEEKPFMDEMEQLRLAAAMEANPCRDMVIWIPEYPVLLGDFKTLFDYLRENPSEKDPSLVIPEVDDPPEVEGPSAPRNLAAILQALENGDSEIPAAEYEDVSMLETIAEDHVAVSDPVEDVPANDTSMEAADQDVIPVDRSCEASSDEPSHLARTLEEIQRRQDEQSSRNDKYDAFIERQEGHNNEMKEMLAKILSRLGPS